MTSEDVLKNLTRLTNEALRSSQLGADNDYYQKKVHEAAGWAAIYLALKKSEEGEVMNEVYVVHDYSAPEGAFSTREKAALFIHEIKHSKENYIITKLCINENEIAQS